MLFSYKYQYWLLEDYLDDNLLPTIIGLVLFNLTSKTIDSVTRGIC